MGGRLRSCSCSCSYSYSYSSLDLRTNRPAGEVHVFLLVLVLVPPLGGGYSWLRLARRHEWRERLKWATPPNPPFVRGGRLLGGLAVVGGATCRFQDNDGIAWSSALTA